jgi:hypothetical protein
MKIDITEKEKSVYRFLASVPPEIDNNDPASLEYQFSSQARKSDFADCTIGKVHKSYTLFFLLLHFIYLLFFLIFVNYLILLLLLLFQHT